MSKEEVIKSMSEEAAYLIANKKFSREAAISRVIELNESREDSSNFVISDEDTGEIQYLHSELEEEKFEKTNQIKQIAKELYDSIDDAVDEG
ncbi:MAG: hypothetical protein M0Q24_01485 [Sulfurimonas sp.]|uniref:hypothetical protein n=1 Tax=Sulfurimonas sp. TaxID=2022749 RepID=UPI0026007650|nr:hypothetical protein [Sulfurimonas sp.]MCK9490735.1 hypothetical protein [Sulfurimonas sp.]